MMASPSETRINPMEYDDHAAENDQVTSSELCQQSDSNEISASNADKQALEARNNHLPITSPQLRKDAFTEDITDKTAKVASPLSNFKEFPSIDSLDTVVPQKIQRGFWSTSVSITSMDSEGEYFLYGTDAGCGFVYNRTTGELLKLSLESRKEKVTRVKLFVGIDCQCGLASSNGRILIAVLSTGSAPSTKRVNRYPVVVPHTSEITCLQWSSNGMKLFSGDKSGKVCVVDLDFEKNDCRHSTVLKEDHEVVSVSYKHKVLLVSTTERTIVFNTNLPDPRLLCIGSGTRQGVFGACFGPDSVSTLDLLIYCARPGYRIWIADIEGRVTKTLLLRDSVSDPSSEIKLVNLPLVINKDQQFRKLMFFQEKYLLAYSGSSLFLIDTVQPSVLATSHDFSEILDMSTTKSEIFVLCKNRSIHRLAEGSDKIASKRKLLEEENTNEALKKLKELKSSLSDVKTNLSFRALRVPGIKSEPEHELQLQAENVHEMLPDVKPTYQETDQSQETSIATTGLSATNDCEEEPSSVVQIKNVQESSESNDNIESEDTAEIVFQSRRKRNESRSRNRPSFHDLSISASERSSSSSKNISSDASKSDTSLTDCSENTDMHCNSELIAKISQGEKVSCPESTSSEDLLSQIVAQRETNNDKLDIESTHLCANELFPFSDTEPVRDFSSDPSDTEVETLINEDSLHPNTDISQPLEILDQQNAHFRKTYSSSESEADISPGLEQDLASSPDDIYAVDTWTRDFEYEKTSVSDTECLPPTSDKESASTSLTSPRNTDIHVPGKLVDAWSAASTPHHVLSITASGNFVCYIDVSHRVYLAEELIGDTFASVKWRRFSRTATKVSISPSGDVIWLVGKTGTVYASVLPAMFGSDEQPLELVWQEVTSKASCVALGHGNAFVYTYDGVMKSQSGLTRSKPFAGSWNLISWKQGCGKVVEMAVTESMVWCRTDDGSLLRSDIESIDGDNVLWETIVDKSPFISSLASDGRNCVFTVDKRGVVSFVEENGAPWEVNVGEYLDEDRHLIPNSVVQSLPTNIATSAHKMQRWMRRPARARFVAANDMSVWIVHDKHIASVTRGPISGQRWDVTTPLGVALSTKWQHITTSSIFSADIGNWVALVWASRPNGEIFCFQSQEVATTRPVSLPPPLLDSVPVVCMSACKGALWVLYENGDVYIRSGVSKTCLQGTDWSSLDTREQLGDAKITHISCGTQNVWAVDSTGQILFRIGVGSVDPHSFPPAWIPIESPPGCHVTQIECGPSDNSVWAIDELSVIHTRTGISPNMPVGTKWEVVPGSHGRQICVSNSTVWGLRTSGNLLRRCGISQRNPLGNYWRKVRGKFERIAVTPYDELWAIDDVERLYHLYSSLYCPLVVEAQYKPDDHLTDDDFFPPGGTDKEWEFL